jgi:hypothetical protein
MDSIHSAQTAFQNNRTGLCEDVGVGGGADGILDQGYNPKSRLA